MLLALIPIMKGRAWLALAGLYGGWKLVQRRRTMSLRGRTALITGGATGLGLALAEALIREGCVVALCGRNPDHLRRAQERLESLGKTPVLTLRCDVRDSEEVSAMIDEVESRLGPIDLLINNAGIIQVGPWNSLSLEDYKDAIDTMYWGVVHTCYSALPRMRERGRGSIANITSIGGLVSVPHLLPYSSAKHAAVGFSRGLAAELRQEGIHVTTVVPGLMRTGSYINARFAEPRAREYAWFSFSSTLPGLAMEIHRAARGILRAIRLKKAFYILGVPAKVLYALDRSFPSASARVLATANRVLEEDLSGLGPFSSAKRYIEGYQHRDTPVLIHRNHDKSMR